MYCPVPEAEESAPWALVKYEDFHKCYHLSDSIYLAHTSLYHQTPSPKQKIPLPI
jgi:hypothetical protein